MTKEREIPASALDHYHCATNYTNNGCLPHFPPLLESLSQARIPITVLYETASQFFITNFKMKKSIFYILYLYSFQAGDKGSLQDICIHKGGHGVDRQTEL